MSRPFHVAYSIRSVLQTSSNPNHIFNRTFIGAANLLETGISTPAQALGQSNEEQPQEIPHALKAEIIQLETAHKFKILPDADGTKKKIQLVCYCEDKFLPYLPPIYITIPASYPFMSPNCSLRHEDYLGTEFLRNMYSNFTVRTARLPHLYSLTRLLEAWETAVRETLSPNRAFVADISEIFGV